jgi:hypothetical protein
LVLAVLPPEKNKFLRARGPFATKADAMHCATRINPDAEVVVWDSNRLDFPDVVTPPPSMPMFRAA